MFWLMNYDINILANGRNQKLEDDLKLNEAYPELGTAQPQLFSFSHC